MRVFAGISTKCIAFQHYCIDCVYSRKANEMRYTLHVLFERSLDCRWICDLLIAGDKSEVADTGRLVESRVHGAARSRVAIRLTGKHGRD